MKKHLSSVIIVLLVAFGIIYRQPLYDWLKSHQSTGLAGFTIPSDLLQKLGSDSSLLPGPLRSSDNASVSALTRSGVIAQTNLQRKENGLEGLTENAQLTRAAQLKLKDMFEKQYFEHISPEGKGPSDLADQAGYQYVMVGENLALGNFKNDEALVIAWMNSPGHRANILNERYMEIGVAVGKGMFEGKQTWLAVQEFGMPQSACPGVDGKLKEQIDANQATINTMAADLARRKAELENKHYASREEYNREVQEYNAIVGKFNALIDTTKQMVSQYNTQVNNLNSCIQG